MTDLSRFGLSAFSLAIVFACGQSAGDEGGEGSSETGGQSGRGGGAASGEGGESGEGGDSGTSEGGSNSTGGSAAGDGGLGNGGDSGESGASGAPDVGGGGAGGVSGMAGSGGMGGSGTSGGGSGGEGGILARSVEDFSGTQGFRGWLYGYVAPATSAAFQPMTEFDGSIWHVQNGTYWTRLTQEGGHPNGVLTASGRASVDHWSVRRWVSSVSGSITVHGEVANIDNSQNGVAARVVVDGSTLWSQLVVGVASPGSPYSVQATVSVGSTVDLVIDPYESNDLQDTFRFTAVIER